VGSLSALTAGRVEVSFAQREFPALKGILEDSIYALYGVTDGAEGTSSRMN
jgi:hypothetical protein